MDPLDFLEPEQLLQFFHRKKTEMSCMEKPQTFLNQLRDHNLIPEDRYKKVIRMKSKENMRNGLYGVLDWLESKRPQHIQLFWTCVFEESIMNQYPTLRLLRNNLMDGSFQFSSKLPERVEKEEREGKKRKEPAEDEEGEGKEGKTGKKKKKQRTGSVCDDEEQPGPSSQSTPSQKKKLQKPSYSSPLRKGEKRDIWTWALYKTQLPVTCGDQEGTLSRDRLAKGEKCIVVKNQWFTPTEFEKFAGKASCKNWKVSIQCRDTPLRKLIQDGHLKSPGYKRLRTKAQKSLFRSKQSQSLTTGSDTDGEEDGNEEVDQEKEDQASTSDKESSSDVTDEEGEEEDAALQEPGGSNDSSSKTLFKVTCGAAAGTLHKDRFASGTCGKSIRTEKSWMSPVDFVKEGSSQPDASWMKDIQWEGKPLAVLLKANVLEIHSMLCKCRLCIPDCKNQESQKNDDECFICRSEGEKDLVVCDQCPRSFHQECHLPHVEDAMLGDDSPWICTFCVLKASQAWRYSAQLTHEKALSRQISEHLLECQYLLLSLYNADEDQIFATDPSIHVRGYTNLIRSLMWLEKVAENLLNRCYQTVGEFVSDVQLIFTNCATFNRDNAEFQAMGVRLKELFEREFKNVFSIQQETVNPTGD
uniref:uncharacterized protein sp100.1 isoform X2 n=1 Tax=Centroberyx gerrardi TaxID=166262 RepID=UPI003AAA474F